MFRHIDEKFPLVAATRRCLVIFSFLAVIFHFFFLSIVIQTIKLDITPHYGGARNASVRFMPVSENSVPLVFVTSLSIVIFRLGFSSDFQLAFWAGWRLVGHGGLLWPDVSDRFVLRLFCFNFSASLGLTPFSRSGVFFFLFIYFRRNIALIYAVTPPSCSRVPELFRARFSKFEKVLVGGFFK